MFICVFLRYELQFFVYCAEPNDRFFLLQTSSCTCKLLLSLACYIWKLNFLCPLAISACTIFANIKRNQEVKPRNHFWVLPHKAAPRPPNFIIWLNQRHTVYFLANKLKLTIRRKQQKILHAAMFIRYGNTSSIKANKRHCTTASLWAASPSSLQTPSGAIALPHLWPSCPFGEATVWLSVQVTRRSPTSGATVAL